MNVVANVAYLFFLQLLHSFSVSAIFSMLACGKKITIFVLLARRDLFANFPLLFSHIVHITTQFSAMLVQLIISSTLLTSLNRLRSLSRIRSGLPPGAEVVDVQSMSVCFKEKIRSETRVCPLNVTTLACRVAGGLARYSVCV